MQNVVIDTCVVVAGLRSRAGASRVLLDLWGDRFQAVLSVPLVLEYEATLMEPRLQLKLSNRDVSTLLDYWCGTSKLVDIHYRTRPTLRDPNDEMVLETALSGACETIITFNTNDFSRSETWGVRTLTPRDFLFSLRNETEV
jgi:putative PIN family toxin of toxin-antitoxin system